MNTRTTAAPYRDSMLGLAFLMGGLIIWSVRFLLVYGFTAVACAKGLAETNIGPIGLIQLVLILATLAALAANVWLIVRGLADQRAALGREPAHFVASVAAAIAALSILAITWETIPVFMLPPCT